MATHVSPMFGIHPCHLNRWVVAMGWTGTSPRRGWRLVGLLAGLPLMFTVGGGTVEASALALPEPTTTTLGSTPNPSVAGQVVTLTATVTKATGTPAGSVQFLEGLSVLSTLPLVGGVAQLATSSLPVGSHDITAAFLPDPLDLSSLPSVSALLVQVVNTAGGGICLPGDTTPVPSIAARTKVVGPSSVRVGGVAVPNDVVDLYQRTYGQSAFAKVATTTAGASGAYSFNRNVGKRTTFVARDRGVCGDATSVKATTKVALKVVASLASRHRGRLRMNAATRPRAADELVRFYRLHKGGARELLAKVATGPSGSAHKTIRANSGRRYRVIAKVTAPPGNLRGQSRTTSLKVS